MRDSLDFKTRRVGQLQSENVNVILKLPRNTAAEVLQQTRNSRAVTKDFIRKLVSGEAVVQCKITGSNFGRNRGIEYGTQRTYN